MLPVWLPDPITSDLDRALHYTLLWGLEGLVLRTVGKRADRVPHVNEPRLKRRLSEHDLPAVAADPGLFEQPAAERGAWMNDLVLLDEALAFCTRVGCSRVLVGALPGESDVAADALRRAGERAARRGCILAVRNEPGGRPTGEALAALLADIDHPAVRACWSPADALEAGEEPEVGLDALAGQIEIVTVRDGRREGGGWQPATLGEGAVGWPDVLRGLHAHGFDGPLCLDLRDASSPKDGLRAATALIQMARAAIRGNG
ncbi:MAG: TIM barrel protein [Rhodothermales bacterium]